MEDYMVYGWQYKLLDNVLTMGNIAKVGLRGVLLRFCYRGSTVNTTSRGRTTGG